MKGGSNLCTYLVMCAAWWHCRKCGSLSLFVNEQDRTDGEFICDACQALQARMQFAAILDAAAEEMTRARPAGSAKTTRSEVIKVALSERLMGVLS
jgi:hypothetical protein